MSEVNEKMISEFLELLKKVNSLEMQVQSISRDHTDVMGKTTKIAQSIQDTLTESLRKQNELVQKTNDSLANQVNSALSKVGDIAVSSVKSHLDRNQNKDNERIRGLEKEVDELTHHVNNINKFFSSFIAFFKQEAVENPKLTGILTTKIKDVEFTHRTINCLLAENIETVGQLINHSEQMLLKTPNLGKKSLTEIKNWLSTVNLELRRQ